MYKIILFFCLSIVSCEGVEKKTIIKEIVYTNATTNLVSMETKLDNPILNPGKIISLDNDLLVVFDNRDRDSLFKVFELPDLNLKYSWGVKGNGPNELSDAELFYSSIICDKNGIELYNLDTNSLKVFKVNDETFEQVEQKTLKYDFQLDALQQISKLSDSLYVGEIGWVDVGEPIENMFIALEPNNTSELFRFGKYPESALSSLDKYSRFKPLLLSKPDGTKLISFFSRMDEGWIFNDKGEMLIKLIIGGKILDKEKYRLELSTTDDFIFVHYLAQEEKYLLDKGLEYQPIIELWNWEGDLKSRLKLDKPVHFFTVSEKHQKLYGISMFVPDRIYEYDLSKIMVKTDE